MKTRKKKKLLILGIPCILLCMLAVFFIWAFRQTSLEFNIPSEETITLEYGETQLPEVTALYKSSFFDKEGRLIPITTKGIVDYTNVGTYTLTYTATIKKQTIHATRTIIIQDTTAPVITLSGASHIVIEEGTVFTDPGASAMDPVDGDLTNQMTVEGSIDPFIYGSQTLTYSVTDSNGNTSTVVRIVSLRESVPPELTLEGENRIFITEGDNYAEPGFIATDNSDGDISNSVQIDSNVDISKAGTYKIIYTATDASGNSVTAERLVYVCTKPTVETLAEPNGKVVYLTFDDGPGPYTLQLLDLLDKYNVKVTFFVTSQYEDYLDLIGEAYRRGHTIAIHTYSHVFSEVYANETAYYTDLNKMSAICEAQTGVKPTIIRFPGGTSNSISKKYSVGIMRALTQSLPQNGYQYCDWNVDSMDAGGAKTADEVTTNVIRNIQDFRHSIVLQHDTKQFSVEAVDEILKWGLENGYTFLPMTEDTPMYHHPAYN